MGKVHLKSEGEKAVLRFNGLYAQVEKYADPN
jgi:hypothetical protein